MSSRMQIARNTILLLLLSVSATNGCQVLFGDFEIVGDSLKNANAGGGVVSSLGGSLSATGGSSATGGYTTIVPGSGGAQSFGGTPGVGGSAALGGSTSDSGSPGSGGSEPTGGAFASGGISPTGGARSTGGATVATGGTKPTGGTTSIGGALPTGGTKPTGGATATAGARATGGGTSTITCGASSVAFGGICWYLGTLGANCTTTCASHGGPSVNTPAVVGTAAQGGSLSSCAQIVELLAVTGTAASVASQFGVGCLVYHSGSQADLATGPYWESTTAYNVTDMLPNGQRVCGCVQ